MKMQFTIYHSIYESLDYYIDYSSGYNLEYMLRMRTLCDTRHLRDMIPTVRSDPTRCSLFSQRLSVAF